MTEVVLPCRLTLLLARIVQTQAGTPDTPQPGRAPAPSCTAYMSAPSLTSPNCSARPPHPAPRHVDCTSLSTCRCPRGSSTSTPNHPQRTDQEQQPGLVTRHVTGPTPVCPAQSTYPGTFTGRQPRYLGPGIRDSQPRT